MLATLGQLSCKRSPHAALRLSPTPLAARFRSPINGRHAAASQQFSAGGAPGPVHQRFFSFASRRAASGSTGGPSSSSSSSSSRAWALLPISVGGGVLYALHTARDPIASESENSGGSSSSSSSSKEEAGSDSRYAAPIEEQEDAPHPNALVRLLQTLSKILHNYILEPFGTAKRFIVLVIYFAPVILAAPMLLVGRRTTSGRRRGRRVSKKEDGERWGAIWWYGFLVKQMERAGPTFIKLAQWAASRQDLFPKDLCDRLGKLHSNGKPHSFKYTKKVIERVFGRPFDEIFEDFGQEPMGIGAVAQVYKATLRPDLLPPAYLEAKHPSPNNKTAANISHQLALTYDEDAAPPAIPTASVAIKILHPKVERTIRRDIRIMGFFARVINSLPGAEWLSFPEEVEVFAGMMFSQLDLRNEAENLKRFESNFRTRRSAISFPRPLSEFSTKELLIEEYEEALPLKAFLNNGGAGFDHRIANLGLDAFLNMLLLDNFTHADLHPGNIMVKFYRPTTKSLLRSTLTSILSKFDESYARSGAGAHSLNTDEQTEENVVQRLMPLRHDQDAWLDELERLDELGYQPELVFIDAGLVTSLSPTNRRNFLDLFGAVAEFDGALAGHLMVERCRTPELVVDEETFALRMQGLVLSVKSKTFSLAKIKISDVLSEVLLAVRNHHVKMEADFVNTVISILLLEGIGRQLDPSMDLFKSAVPILRSLGRQLSRQEGGMGMIKGAAGRGSSGAGAGGGGLAGGATLKDLGPMLKIWVYMEARSWLLNVAEGNTVEAFMRYDWLTPNV